ncbi:hypothetical protein V1525DRAFT_260598 [Lipomyces kononenkoae]|uniref:Uncharacterized protein n=1 Tax=Lipomyces kononenkoae TaxID=34357 RepID=A0ACC3SV53_LIPKO
MPLKCFIIVNYTSSFWFPFGHRHQKMPITLDVPSLRNELEILHLIVHRNRNQHHQAKWWKYVSIIHRNLKNLVYIPQQEPRQQHKSAAKKAGRDSKDEKKGKKCEKLKRNKKATCQNDESIKNEDAGRRSRKDHSAIVFNRTPESEATGLIRLDLSPRDLKPVPFDHVERAEYLVYRVIPKAFNAFQRVIAHGQYVTLGLVLLATLARIWCTLRQDTKVFKPNRKNVPANDSIMRARANDDDLGQIVTRHAAGDLDLADGFAKFGDNEEDINMVQDSDVDSSADIGLQIYDEDEIEDESRTDKSSTPSLRKEPAKRRRIEVDDDMDVLKFFS